MPIAEHSVQIKTLTPLWTGNEIGRCERILETGILGSLRWWTELLMRGAGATVPDPTKGDANEHCPVSKIFGYTGQRRRFRLIVDEITVAQEPIGPRDRIVVDVDMKKGAGVIAKKPSTWHYKGPARKGKFKLRFIGEDANAVAILLGVLRFIECCGALGAKPQLGLGIIRIQEQTIDVEPLLTWLSANRREPSENYPDLPSLRNYFYTTLATSGGRQDTFLRKFLLRRSFTHRNTRHKLFGYVDTHTKERRGTSVSVSLPFDGQIRVFGWVADDDGFRATNVQKIKDELGSLTDCATWFAPGADFILKLREVAGVTAR